MKKKMNLNNPQRKIDLKRVRDFKTFSILSYYYYIKYYIYNIFFLRFVKN